MTEEEKAAAEAAAAAEAEAAEKAKAEAAAKEAEEAAKKKAGQGGDDESKAEVERLQKELEEARAVAKRFEGIDPEKAKADAAAVAAAEKAKRDAEKKAAEAEGNFEKLRQLQNEETAAQVKALQDQIDALQTERDTARREAQSTRIESAFAGSKYLAEETILTGSKAQRLYGDHVALEEGKIVVYDRPATDSKRTRIMDTKGNPLPFDQAIAKVLAADPDKDSFLKTKVKPGANSSTTDGKTVPGASRHDKLKAGLQKLRGS